MPFNKCSQIDKVIFDLAKIPTHTYQSNGSYGSKYTNIVYTVNGEPKRVIINKMMRSVDLIDVHAAIAEIQNNQKHDKLARVSMIVSQYSDIDFSDDDDDCGMYDRCGGNADDAFNMGERSLATRIKKVLYPERYEDQ